MEHTPAKRGQLALVPFQTYVTIDALREAGLSVPYQTPSGLTYHTIYSFGKVTSCTRDGLVKAVSGLGRKASYCRRKSTSGSIVGCFVVPGKFTEPLEAALTNHENEFLTLDQARAFAQAVCGVRS